MATWAFTLTIDSTPYDLTPFVDIPSISRDRRLFSELRPNLDKFSFRCLYDATIFAALIAGTVADIAITKDAAAYFTGTLSPNYRAQIRDGIKLVELIAEDYTLSRMGETIRTPIAWAGYALCTPAAPSTSIVHAIAALAGVTVSASAPVLSTTIPYLIVTVDEKKTLAKLLEDILFDYSYVYRFEEDGELMLTQAVNTGAVTTTGTLTTAAGSANILGEPTIEKAPEKYDDIRVRYNLVEAKTGITLFEDKSGATATSDCEITLEATGDASGRDYYPLSNKIGEVFSAWNNPDGFKIWIATSATLDDEFETGITLDRALVNYYKKCSFGYVNGAGAAKKITKLKITGNAYVIAAQNTARASLSSAKLLFEYEAAYIFTDAAGQAQAKALAQYYAHSDLKITAKSKTAYTLGQYVLFADAVYAGISVKTRVIGIRDTTAARDVYEYALEAVADFSAISLVTEGASPKDPSALDAAAAASAETTAVAARGRTFATIALIEAATSTRDDELAYCQQTASYWKSGVTGTAFVDTGATIPSSSGLVAAWPLDEVPDIPDSAAGTSFVQGGATEAWAGWSDSNSTQSVSNGVIRFTLDSGTNDTYFKNCGIDPNAKTQRFKVRASKTLTMSLLYDNGPGYSSIVSKAITTDWTLIDGYLASGAATNTFLFLSIVSGMTAGDWVEISNAYVGTGAYTTVVPDGSGHGIHGTVYGCTPSNDGLIGDGVNDFVSFGNVCRITGALSLVIKAKLISAVAGAGAGLIGKYLTTGNQRSYALDMYSSSYPRMVVSADGVNGVAVQHNVALSSSVFETLVAVFIPSTSITIYRGGVQVAQETTGIPASLFDCSAGLELYRGVAHAVYANVKIAFAAIYDRALGTDEILGLSLGLCPSLPYRLARWQVEQAATDGIITPLEKKAISALWYAINGNGSTTGSYWTARVKAAALSVSYSAAETARNALYAYLYTTPAILLASLWNMTITITKATYEALWSAYYGAEAALLNSIAAKEGTNAVATAAAAVPTNTPHYKGRYPYASRPTSGLIVDDTCTLYSTTAGERGIYKATNATTLAKQTAPTTEMIADAWADIMWIDNQVTDYGVPTDYTGTGVDFVDVLGANVAFMNKLFTQFVKIQTGGSIRGGDRYDEDGAVVDGTVPGFWIGASGACKVAGIEFEGGNEGNVAQSMLILDARQLDLYALGIKNYRICYMDTGVFAVLNRSYTFSTMQVSLYALYWDGDGFTLGSSIEVMPAGTGNGNVKRLSANRVMVLSQSAATYRISIYELSSGTWSRLSYSDTAISYTLFEQISSDDVVAILSDGTDTHIHTISFAGSTLAVTTLFALPDGSTAASVAVMSNVRVIVVTTEGDTLVYQNISGTWTLEATITGETIPIEFPINKEEILGRDGYDVILSRITSTGAITARTIMQDGAVGFAQCCINGTTFIFGEGYFQGQAPSAYIALATLDFCLSHPYRP